PGDLRPCGDEVVRELTLAAADIEHPLAGPDTRTEERVVADQPMLGVDSVVEVDRQSVDPLAKVVVEREEASQRVVRREPGRRGGPELDHHRDGASGDGALKHGIEKAEEAALHPAINSTNRLRWRSIQARLSNRSTARVRAASRSS